MKEIKNLDGEIWKPFPRWEGYYEISNKGRVKMLPRIVYAIDGKVLKMKGRLKKLTPNQKNKYLMVTLTNRQEKRHETICVHRQVAIVFIPNPQNKPEVNHKCGDKNKITVDDLEWNTGLENKQHAVTHGLHNCPKGNNHAFSRKVGMFSGEELIKEYSHMREAEKEGFTGTGIFQSIKLGCKHGGYNWKYLSDRKWTRKNILKPVVPIGRFVDNKLDKIYTDRNSLIAEGYWIDNIYKCLKGQLKKYRGFTWQYIYEKAA